MLLEILIESLEWTRVWRQLLQQQNKFRVNDNAVYSAKEKNMFFIINEIM